MWPFSHNGEKRARKNALDKACRLLTMQLLGAKDGDRFIEDEKDLWPLGYCFGLLQASLEAVDAKAQLGRSDYESHITDGFGLVFADVAFGVIQYRVSLSSMDDPKFHAGRIAGATEYVQVVNAKAERAYGLSRYLSADS